MTVGREQPTCRAISVFDVPSAASSRILARSAKAARMLWDRLHWPRVRRSSGGMASGGAMAGMGNPAATIPQSSSKFRDDRLALGLLCEAIGMELPVVVLPYLNAAHGKHPALAESIQRLRGCGVQVLFGPDVLPLHRPREGRRELFPWHVTLAALDASQCGLRACQTTSPRHHGLGGWC